MSSMQCAYCPERRYHALRIIDGVTVCFNCSPYAARRKIMTCYVCKRELPCEMHHVKGRKYNDTIPFCLNCHRCLHGFIRIWSSDGRSYEQCLHAFIQLWLST